MWRQRGWVGIGAEITVAIVAFRSAKGRSFAERKTTLFYAPVLGCVLAVLMVRSLAAQENPAANDPTGNAARDETGSDEDAREAAVVARFVAVLEKNPRRGTALDKVYAFQVEHGSLDKFIQTYREKAASTEGPSPSAAMIVGLLESLRGEEAAAAKAFENAERLAPENSLASYYLGQTLVLLGQPDKAIEAFERAIARQPARADLLEMFQALGRVHQRTARNEKALDVWSRLEQQFPNDERVQEQIATTLLEEEAFDAALPRFEKLAQLVKDRGRQLAFRMEAADIRVRLGQTEAALKEFEALLGQLNPDHWIYRDVRRRIEAIYLRTEDRAGLATYYEAWLVKHPDDLDAIVRVAKTYTALGRDESASEWLERGVKLAPSRKELRRALIDRLLEARQVSKALAHFEQLDRDEPNHSDTLRDWGRAILKDSSRDGTARRQAAATVWRKLSEARPMDALVASQVGDLLRQAEMIDEAVEQYRRAITLAPEATQYREYLGEYFHSLKRPDDALATWRPMAEGDQHTAANVGRLAEVLAGFGYVEEAVTNYADACRLDPKDFGRHLKHIDLLSRAERHDEALVQLGLVEKLIANDEEREAWLSRDLRSLQAAGKLKERIAEAVVGWALLPVRSSPSLPVGAKDEAKDKERTGKSAHPTADQWYWLARAYEVDGQRLLAAQAVTKASQLAPRSMPILRASARLHEARRDFTAAVEVYARLVTLDRRYRTEYLQKLATLERQLGHRDKSLQAGRDLIAAAPGNPELSEFFAQLCFQLNAVDEGLNALRRSVRANSTDPMALVRLASALIERQRATEAIDLLWRAFEKSQKLDDRLLVVQKLIEASAVGSQQPRVIERLQRMQRERSQRREMTLCLAQAYQALSNDTQAQAELETLLSEEARDPVLLAQLRQLAEKRQDWTAAANYQREVWQLTNDKRDRFLLAGLLMRLDQIDEAVELLVGGESSKELTPDVLTLLDGLYEAGKSDMLLARLKPLRARFPDNWELLYREGVALAGKNPDEAAKRFEAVLAMNLRHDEPALTGSSKAGVPATSATGTQMPLVDRMVKIQAIMQMTSLVRTAVRTGAVPSRPTPATSAPARSGTSGSTARVFTPTQYLTQSRLYYVAPRDYGEGRLAAWGWLTSFAKKDRKDRDPEAMKARLEQLASNATPQSLADQYAIYRFLSDYAKAEQTARLLAQHAEASLEEQALYLQELAQRHQPRQRVMANGQRVLDQAAAAPLYAEELDEALAIYRELAQKLNSPAVLSANLNTILTELIMADRLADASRLLNEEIAKATTAAQLNVLLMVGYRIQNSVLHWTNGRSAVAMTTDTLTRLLDRLIEFQNDDAANRAAITAVMATTTVTVGGRIQMRAMPNYAGIVVQMHLNANPLASHAQTFGLWSRFVRLSSFALAVRLKQPEGRSASATQMVAVPMTATEISPLSLGAVFDRTGPTVLTAVWNRFYSGGKVPDGFFADFESHAQSPDASIAERILWLSSLGHLRWINNEQDVALNAWSEAAALAPDVIELQLNLARLYERAGKTERALEIAEAVQPTTNEWLVERDQMILRRALAAENLPLAKVVAERLSVLKLSPHEVVPLAEQLVKFEMLDQAEVLLSQQTPAPSAPTNVRSTVTSSRNTVTTYRSAVDVRAQRVLLDIQLARGRHDEASVTALALLKLLETTDVRNLTVQQPGQGQIVTDTNGQTYIMTTVNGRPNLQPVNSRTAQPQISVPEYREHIFKALHKTGRLAAMIDDAEAKLKESPRNEALVATLMSYHKVTGNTERIGELTVRQLEIDQDRPEKRYTSIINLLNLGRVDEAAALTKLMLESSPDYFAPRCRDLIVRFKSKQELRKLAKVFESFDWSRYDQHPGVRPTIIELLTAEVETEDIGTKLFLAAWASRPELRYDLLSRTPDGAWWKRPEFAEGLRRLPIPSKEEDLTNQWSTFGRAVKKSAAKPNDPGTLPEAAAFVTVLNRMLTIEADRDQLKTLASDVEKARQQFPNWKAGEVLLALIDLRRGRVAAGRDSLVALLPTMRPVMKTSPLIPWEIANELARHDESFDAAVQYYEAALHERGIEAWTASSSPVRGIIQTLAERGRKTDARRMLLALLPANVQRGGDLSQLPSAIELNVAQWIGRELRGIGYPIDAIHIYQGALERTESKSYGNGGHDPRTDLQSSLLIAFKELQPAALLDYFAAVGDAAPQLDLQLFVTELTTPSVRLRSRWTPLLEAIATNADHTATLKSLLAKACERHPDDLSTRILATQLALLTKDEPGAKSLVNQLVRYAEEHPLEPLSKSTITATMQRRASQPHLALWLIARAAWTVPELKADAEKLATAALAAANQQSDAKYAEAITTEQTELAKAKD